MKTIQMPFWIRGQVFVAKPEIDILKVVHFLCSSTLQLLKNTQVMCQQYFSVAKTDAKDFFADFRGLSHLCKVDCLGCKSWLELRALRHFRTRLTNAQLLRGKFLSCCNSQTRKYVTVSKQIGLSFRIC